MMRRVGRAALAVVVVAFAVLAYIYLTLPDVRPLATAPPKTTAFIELRARESLARGAKPRRVQRWVGYPQISSHLKRAVLVAEDSAFWQHEGIDVDELRKSIETNLERGRFSRGGSTITQQLAKNLYLSPSRNPLRKLRELLIARRLEVELSKRRILELYLNVIEWGDGVYGAEAAARTYFHRSSAALGPEEAALLAGAIINPRTYSPSKPNARLRGRQQLILRRMGQVEPPPVEAVVSPIPPTLPLPAPADELTPSIEPPASPDIETPRPTEPIPPDPDRPYR